MVVDNIPECATIVPSREKYNLKKYPNENNNPTTTMKMYNGIQIQALNTNTKLSIASVKGLHLSLRIGPSISLEVNYKYDINY